MSVQSSKHVIVGRLFSKQSHPCCCLFVSKKYHLSNWVTQWQNSHSNPDPTPPLNESKHLSLLQQTKSKIKKESDRNKLISDTDTTSHDTESEILYEIKHQKTTQPISDNIPVTFNECQTLEEIMNILWQNTTLDSQIFTNAIKQCNILCDFKGALRIFHSMQTNYDTTVNIQTYNTLLQCLCDCDRTELAFKYLCDLDKVYDISPNIDTFQIVLTSCKDRVSLLEIAEKVWHKMIFECSIVPNIGLCNAMLSVYCKCGEIQKSEIIWNHLLSNIGSVTSDTCVEMINVYSLKKDETKLNQMRQFMKTHKIPINYSHLSAIIKYYLSVGQPYKALQLFEDNEHLPITEQSLSQLCLAYIQLKDTRSIFTLTMKYQKMFNKNVELNGLLFEAYVIKYESDYGNTDLIETFRSLVHHGQLTGYWCKRECDEYGRQSLYWIDLHGIYRRKRMMRFILRYVFEFEREYIQNQLCLGHEIVVLCGKGVHREDFVGFYGGAKVLCEQELLSWNPPIKSKVYEKSDGCLVLDSDDVRNFYKRCHERGYGDSANALFRRTAFG